MQNYSGQFSIWVLQTPVLNSSFLQLNQHLRLFAMLRLSSYLLCEIQIYVWSCKMLFGFTDSWRQVPLIFYDFSYLIWDHSFFRSMNTVWIVMSSWRDAFAGQMPWWLFSPSLTTRALNYSVTFTIMFDSCIQGTWSLSSSWQTKLISCISKRWSLSRDFSWLICWAVLSMKYLSVKTITTSSMPSISSVKKSINSK